MTELERPVSRRTTLFLDRRMSARDRDRITVTIYPTNQIGFRANHCRKEVRLDLAVVYKMALIQQAKEIMLRKQQEAKASGKRFRKPKRSLLF